MCGPVAIGLGAAVAALAIGSAVVGHIGQNQLASANQKAANLNYANRKDVIAQQGVQLDEEASQRTEDSAITSLRAEGEIANSAGDMGYAPTSITQSINAAMFGIGRQDTIAQTNDTNQRQQLAAGLEGADITRQSQILQHGRSSWADLGLGVGNGIVSGVKAGIGAKQAGY